MGDRTLVDGPKSIAGWAVLLLFSLVMFMLYYLGMAMCFVAYLFGIEPYKTEFPKMWQTNEVRVPAEKQEERFP